MYLAFPSPLDAIRLVVLLDVVGSGLQAEWGFDLSLQERECMYIAPVADRLSLSHAGLGSRTSHDGLDQWSQAAGVRADKDGWFCVLN